MMNCGQSEISSQPLSVHGVGTVRHWAAVKSSDVQCRHNVSARDGEIPASRRPGAGVFPVHAPPGLLTNARLATRYVHPFIPPFTRPADAVTHPAGRPPQIHGPATATGPASFYTTAHFSLKSKISNRIQIVLGRKTASLGCPIWPLQRCNPSTKGR